MLLFDDRGAGRLVERRLRRREHLGEHGLDGDERLICARHLLARLIHARTAALELAMCAHLHHNRRGRAHCSRNGSQRRNQFHAHAIALTQTAKCPTRRRPT